MGIVASRSGRITTVNDSATALVTAAVVIAVVMLSTWVVSLALRNASIVDIVWGCGFVAVAWAVLALTDGDGGRRALIVTMTTVWGVRLGAYLWWRNHGRGEDFRYRSMRKRHGDRFPIVSLTHVYALQGALMWIVSLPVQLGLAADGDGPGPIAWIGLAIWIVGFVFESVGDWQLARFRRTRTSADEVMDRGLWRFTRHPNYFGDACVWWGIALVAAETGTGAIGIVGALAMTVLLLKYSGVPILERSLRKRRPAYADYAARTSAFIPLPPRRSRSTT